MKHGETKVTESMMHEPDGDLIMVAADMHSYYINYDQHCECDGVCDCPHQRSRAYTREGEP